jgi:hypothetical protein
VREKAAMRLAVNSSMDPTPSSSFRQWVRSLDTRNAKEIFCPNPLPQQAIGGTKIWVPTNFQTSYVARYFRTMPYTHDHAPVMKVR